MALESPPQTAAAALVAPVSPPTLTPRTWMAIALLGAVAAGLLSLRQSDGGLTWNVWLFLQLNQLGALAPTAWSIWTVSGLGLSAYVALALVDAPPRGRAARAAPTAAQAQAQSQLLAALIWSFVVGGLVTQGAKHLLHAARPPAVLGVDAITVIGEALMSNSMPSGHATTAAALATLLCLSGRIGWRGQALAWLWALGVLLSRIAVGAHWPVDVCVGLGLGIAIAHLGIALAARGGLARAAAHPLGQLAQLVGLGVASAVLASLHTGYPLALPAQQLLGALGVAVALWRLRHLLQAGRRDGWRAVVKPSPQAPVA